jgi:AraC-like DNA-binding protein
MTTRGNIRVETLVKQSGFSTSQFQRRFAMQVGLSPKVYARTARFDAALTSHRNQPAKPWTQVVHEAGYFDQAHFIKECHALVGLPPGQFIGDWDNIFSPDD